MTPTKNKRIFLTGAGGFVGSHVLRHVLMNTNWEIIAPVTFKHQGKNDRISSALEGNEEWQKRVQVIMLDLAAPIDHPTIDRIGRVDEIWNIASNSHVDTSILEPASFIQNNVALITNVLEFARVVQPQLFLQMSTDEVYGPAADDYRHKEWDALRPSNPYSASKASQEAICYSYWRTYDVPVIITNTMNIIGEMQDPQKFVPLVIKRLLGNNNVPVHVGEDGEAGSRFYLHARNLADAWVTISNNVHPATYKMGFEQPDRFNIVGEREIRNDDMVHLIAEILGVEARIMKVNFHSSRPGHDLRYALDGSKIAEHLHWSHPVSFEESLRKTVLWTKEHPEWLL